MKIQTIEALPIRIPRDVDRTTGTAGLPSHLEQTDWDYRWSAAFPTLYAVHFETALVKITTDTGLVGWGEAQAPLAPQVEGVPKLKFPEAPCQLTKRISSWKPGVQPSGATPGIEPLVSGALTGRWKASPDRAVVGSTAVRIAPTFLPSRPRPDKQSPQRGADQISAQRRKPWETNPPIRPEPCKGRLNPFHVVPHPTSRLAAKRRLDVSLG